jgi:hypothetical protein
LSITSSAPRLTVVRPGLPLPDPEAGETVVAFDDFARLMTSGRALAHAGRYRQSRILVHRLESAGRPLPLGLALRWMTRGDVTIEDVRGRRRAIDTATLSRWVAQVAVEPFKIDALLRRVGHTVGAL